MNRGLETLFNSYINLSPEQAIALVRAARLYQDALRIAETQPAFAWLFFVSALETAAVQHRKTTTASVEVFLNSQPCVANWLREAGGEELLEKVADKFSHLLSSTTRFINFALDFLPPPPPRPENAPGNRLLPWNRKKMKTALNKIYEYRSKALHSGEPLPAPMSWPLVDLDVIKREWEPLALKTACGRVRNFRCCCMCLSILPGALWWLGGAP